MRTVILAGGRGTRLAPLTTVLPKPLIPIGDETVLEILIRRLAICGMREITMAVGHLASLLMAYFGDGERFGVSIDYSVEDEPLGTAGPLRLVENLDSSFVVLNGDLLTDLDFREMIAFHESSGAVATVGTFHRTHQVDFGVIRQDATGRIESYVEKPEHEYLVSIGAYVFDPAVLEFLDRGPRDLPDLVTALIAEGQEVMGYQHPGYWIDIGRHDDYALAVEEYESVRRRILS